MGALVTVASGRDRSGLGASCLWRAKVLVGIVMALVTPAVTRGQDNPESKYEASLKQAIHLFGDAKFRECGDALEVLVKQFPKGADGYYYLGLSRLEMKQWRAAREAFTRYSDLSPASAEARRFIGVTYLQEGSYAEAVASLEKALAIDANDEEAKEYITRAKALLQTRAIAPPVAVPPVTPEPVATARVEAQPKIAEPPASKVESVPQAVEPARPSEMAAKPQANPASKSVSSSGAEPKPTAGASNTNKPKDVEPPKDGFRGVVGMAGDTYWGWLSVGGLFLMTFIWKFVAAMCGVHYRLPLTDQEIQKTGYICLAVMALFHFIWWGNNGTWWITVLVIIVWCRMWAWTAAVFAGHQQSAMAQFLRSIEEASQNR